MRYPSVVPLLSVEPNPPGADDWRRALVDLLTMNGIAIAHGLAVTDLKAFLDERATLFNHPDSDHDGVTHITPRDASSGGFSRHRLTAHTDRAMVDEPPSVLGLVMHEPAAQGGEAYFIDGIELVRFMRSSGFSPNMIVSIELHDHQSDVSVPMFQRISPTSWIIRYRDDDVAAPRSGHRGLIECLQEGLHATARYLPLVAGDGYVLNNRRWLHGRTSFVGHRSASRLLYSTATADNVAPAVAIPELSA